jgi:plastocyanin
VSVTTDAAAPTTDAAAETTVATTEPPAPDDEYTVIVDNAQAGFPASYNEFYPSELTVPQGATISFSMPLYQGEPHNVAIGQVVDAATLAFRALPPDTLIIPGAPIPGLDEAQAAAIAKMPPALPPNLESTEVAFSKLAPCWLEDADPPIGAPCPPEQRDIDQVFTGEQQYVVSPIFMQDDDEFRVELADDIAPGVYQYLCTLHTSSMYGSFEVVADPTAAETPDEVAQRSDDELTALNAELQPIADEVIAQTGPDVQAGEVTGGLIPPYSINVFPATVTIPTGGTVTWDVHGAHMFTFNPPPDQPLFVTLERGDDQIVRPTSFNLEAPGPGQPGMPPGFPTGPVAVDGGSFDGESYLHSGLLFGRIGPLPPTTYSLTFTAPGVYTYYCQRHPGMAGEVAVT